MRKLIDADLPFICHHGRFAPVQIIKKWLIEFAVAGQRPAVVLFRSLGLKIPQNWSAKVTATLLF